MEIRYAPGESPAEINEAFARCAAAGDVLLELTYSDPLVDRGLVEVFEGFARFPELRPVIETGLATLAKIALAGAASTGLDHAGVTALDAAGALAAGDLDPAAALAIEIADRAGLGGAAHRLLARWAWTLLSDVAAAGPRLSGAAALESAADNLDASARALAAAADALSGATRH